ncbi:hypothetical protein LCGC14_1391200 [marine sediment metagenome]|uniref:Uncharacterized protein n=1 Tax=marine sediment metagenome TaxID=412755 RepID=A0A0F9N1I5_9ZZZZ
MAEYRNGILVSGTEQREPFIFRPGATAMAGGFVAAGTRSGSAPKTSATVVNTTEYTQWEAYTPRRAGKIDGKATGGVLQGQLTIGVKCSAGTGTAKLTAEIANTANTSTAATALTLTGTITITTAEIFQTYDMPYLKTGSTINAVPFSVRAGAQHQQGSSSIVFRIMESSYIQGEFEPGT